MSIDNATGTGREFVATAADIRQALLICEARAAGTVEGFVLRILDPGQRLTSVWPDVESLEFVARGFYREVTLADRVEAGEIPHDDAPELAGIVALDAAGAVVRTGLLLAGWRLTHGPDEHPCGMCVMFADRVSDLAAVGREDRLCGRHDGSGPVPAVTA